MEYKTTKPVSNEKTDVKSEFPQYQPTGGPITSRLTQEDTFMGEKVDLNYSVIPEEKDAIQANLKAAGDAVKAKFGLDERGMPELK